MCNCLFLQWTQYMDLKKTINHPGLWQDNLWLLLNKRQTILKIPTLHKKCSGIKSWNGDNLVCFKGDMEVQFLLENVAIYVACVIITLFHSMMQSLIRCQPLSSSYEIWEIITILPSPQLLHIPLEQQFTISLLLQIEIILLNNKIINKLITFLH